MTRRALKELDRRNTQAAPSPPIPPNRRAQRPLARKFLARSRRNRQTARYTADYLRYREPRILKDIKLFARHGGPDLSDLRNVCIARYLPAYAKADSALQCPEPIHPSDHKMSSRGSSSRRRRRGSATISSIRPTSNTTKTTSTGVYSRNFQQHIIDYDVFPDEYEYPDGSVPAEPNNWEDLKQKLTEPRPSLSPSQFSDGKFKKFKRTNANAAKEKQVSELVIPIIEGTIGNAKCRSGGIPFTNLSPLTDGTLKPGNPDVYYGARPEQLGRKIRNELGGHIIPST